MERSSLLGEKRPVGGQRQIGHPGNGNQPSHELGQVAPEERLATGETQLVHSFGHECPRHPFQFLEGQQRLTRQPGVGLLRHAVVTAQVAAISNGDAERPERASEEIGDRIARHDAVGPTAGTIPSGAVGSTQASLPSA